eukprot:TRINITY_DN1488_c0_g1_i4.p1 TRINITY_DN1488_c0_g1~~TRINITY_DN1488_c0_g1_i4.p1  ORF type:complete len:133 (+),score=6.09 TRINITY_DN1488_c0_g1_i4:41-439(+)
MAREPGRIRRRDKKNITSGVAHINASFNNTMITITDAQGNAISWSSADPVNVGERDDHALVGGDIDPGNTSHLFLHAPQGLFGLSGHPYLNAHSSSCPLAGMIGAGAGSQTAKSPVGTRKGDACRTCFEHVE